MTNSNSKMPDGGYQPTYGSGLLMEGFDFDSEYGEGPLSKRNDPELPRSQNGLSTLPDGFLDGNPHKASDFPSTLVETGDEHGLGNLGSLIKTATPLADLSWLETAIQDPTRVPRNPNDSVLQGLVEAWGVNNRTDGVNFVPNTKFLPQPRSMSSGLPGDQYQDMVRLASRRSAFGTPFDSIIREVAAHLGNDLSRVHEDPKLQKLAADIRSIKAEHGVHGRVYIRDESFPGLLTGKWDSEIKRRCASAAYWLTKPGSKLSAYENYLGKKVVTDVPWRQALAHYRPILEASGKKIASGDPKQVLIAALTSAAEARAERVGGVPTTMPVDTVSAKEAWEVFASAPLPVQEVIVRDDQTMKLAQIQLTRWVSSGLLSKSDASKLLTSSIPPSSILKVAAARITASGKEVTYLGSGIGAKLPETAPVKTAEWAKKKEEEIRLSSLRKVGSAIAGMVKSGELTSVDARKIMALGLEPKELLLVANLRANDPNKDIRGVPRSEHRAYEGAKFRGTTQGTATIHDAADHEADLARVAADRAYQVVEGYVKTGALTQKEATNLLASGMTPREIIRVAEVRAADPTRPKTPPKVVVRAYEETKFTQSPRDISAKSNTAEDESTLTKLAMERAHSTIRGMVKAGVLSEKDGLRLVASSLDPKQLIKVASYRAQDPYKPAVLPKLETKVYADTQYTRHVSASQSAETQPSEVKNLLRWASVRMNEGAAGNRLDSLINSKFSKELLKTADPSLVQLRRKHEGLAGHLYIDASVYASKKGTTGCDIGGQHHRADSVPSVLKMDRCGSCTANVNNFCRKYGKTLVSSVPTKDPVEYQKSMIRSANEKKIEKVAEYNEGEFSLQNDNLDSFEYDNLPGQESLSGIVYGGMDISMDEES